MLKIKDMKKSTLNKIVAIIFILNIIVALFAKNWSAATGWFCAIVWLSVAHGLEKKILENGEDNS